MNSREETREALGNYYFKGDTIYAELCVPGFSKDDIDAYLQDKNLIIEGEREIEGCDELIMSSEGFSVMNSFKNVYRIKQRKDGADFTIDEITVQDGICRIKFKEVESEKINIEVK